jgi:hypothetical protein
MTCVVISLLWMAVGGVWGIVVGIALAQRCYRRGRWRMGPC